jgi:RimJ/RimL family protein N-acetyltransferase
MFRLEAFIEPDNSASTRTAEKAGYVREGVLRSYMEFGGTRRDMAVYARLRDE